jgi:hypothetical protein
MLQHLNPGCHSHIERPSHLWVELGWLVTHVRPHHFDVGVCVILNFFWKFGGGGEILRVKRQEAINEPGQVAEGPYRLYA